METEQQRYYRELAEKQRQHIESIQNSKPWMPCMHDQCSTCHGTGVGRYGPCIHGISCPCPKCSPY